MVTYKAKFPINFLEGPEEDPAEPFTYSVRSFTWDDEPDKHYYRVLCHDIPCDVCEFLSTCQRGKYRDGVFEQLFNDKFPEQLI